MHSSFSSSSRSHQQQATYQHGLVVQPARVVALKLVDHQGCPGVPAAVAAAASTVSTSTRAPHHACTLCLLSMAKEPLNTYTRACTA
jgi:hypothetical protein